MQLAQQAAAIIQTGTIHTGQLRSPPDIVLLYFNMMCKKLSELFISKLTLSVFGTSGAGSDWEN